LKINVAFRSAKEALPSVDFAEDKIVDWSEVCPTCFQTKTFKKMKSIRIFLDEF